MCKCLTCGHVLYDGMCLAKGKFTTLDADACELYKPTRPAEIRSLKAENAKLRELVKELYDNLCNRETILELMGMPLSEAAKDKVKAIIDKCSELGVEVG